MSVVDSMSGGEDIRRIATRLLGCNPLLIFGAPGTGKTTVLKSRAVELINSGVLDVSQILLLSPTRQAAADLRDGIAGLLQQSFSGTLVRTCSSYAFDILVRAWRSGLLPWIKLRPRLLSGAEQDLIIKELLAGHRNGSVPAVSWPKELEKALSTTAFRTEIRSFFDRINEYRLTGGEVREYGKQYSRPAWEALAELYQEYNDTVALRFPEVFDPSAIIGQAHRVLEANPDFLAEEKQSIRCLMVDDVQEFNAGIFEFIHLLAGEKDDAIFTACPPATVQGFRGARPDLIGRLRNLPAMETATLHYSFRMDSGMVEAYKTVAARTGGVYGTKQCLEVEGPPGEGAGFRKSIESHTVGDAIQGLRFIAERLTSMHIKRRIPYRNMAVVARQGKTLHTIAGFLQAQDIPHNFASSGTALGSAPIVQQLMAIYYLAMSPGHHVTSAEAATVLTSGFGGADALSIRKLKRFLKTEHRQEAAAANVPVSLSGDELLTKLLTDFIAQPDELPLRWERQCLELFEPVRRIARMIRNARRKMEHATAHEFLWALWNASDNQKIWHEQALSDTVPLRTKNRAHRNLDTMMELFAVAERFTDRVIAGSIPAFYEQLVYQDLAEDTLVQKSCDDAVFLASPAAVAGKEFDYVVVAEVQEGVWPNMKIRGEIFDTSDFSAAVEQRGPLPPQAFARTLPQPLAQEELRQALKTVRHDELRTFCAAISRASYKVDVVAVTNEEEQASYFLDLVDPYEGTEGNLPQRPLTKVRPPLTLRSLTARLRAQAQEEAANPGPEGKRPAAAALAYMARILEGTELRSQGIVPGDWWGVLDVSSAAELFASGEVPVSPSNIQLVHDSPFIWLMQAAGARSAEDDARRLGLFIHAIAEKLPEGDFQQYRQMLDEQWNNLVSARGWQARREREYAERMLLKLSEYNRLAKGMGRVIAGVEERFDYSVGRARVRGVLDRVYHDAVGKARVVDFKTGKAAQTKQQTRENLQLAAYQLGVESEGNVVSAGAELVYLGTEAKGVVVREQEAIGSLQEQEPWACDLIGEAAELMAAERFEARHQPQRMHSAAFNILCPLCPEGRQVTETGEGR